MVLHRFVARHTHKHNKNHSKNNTTIVRRLYLCEYRSYCNALTTIVKPRCLRTTYPLELGQSDHYWLRYTTMPYPQFSIIARTNTTHNTCTCLTFAEGCSRGHPLAVVFVLVGVVSAWSRDVPPGDRWGTAARRRRGCPTCRPCWLRASAPRVLLLRRSP